MAHINNPDLRSVSFGCPWNGHRLLPNLELRMGQAPLVGGVCMDCGCQVWRPIVTSGLLDGAGNPVEKQAKDGGG